ncbi:MAG: hypothetical protein Q8L40_00185 [Burkholderiales bacterium]|nr:hypothetical protein [Burkholderiales bacterium]
MAFVLDASAAVDMLSSLALNEHVMYVPCAIHGHLRAKTGCCAMRCRLPV